MATSFTHHILHADSYAMHYVTTGAASKQPILFIHGILSNWSNYQDIMKDPYMQKNYYMISVDRLCWGQSKIPGQNSETRVDVHADAILAVLKKITEKTEQKLIVVGHSFGGMIASHLAITAPELIRSLVTVAAHFNPELAEPHWYTRFGNALMIKITLPKHLIRANDEALQIKHELKKLHANFKKLNLPVTIMHGSQDKVVDYEHLPYAKKQFAHLGEQCRCIIIEKGKHFILRENKAEIIQGIRLQ